MKRILFVDDEPAVLAEWEAALESMRGQWEMTFIVSGPRALELMVRAPFDVVVSDAVMPGMDGLQFLLWILKRFPRAVRIGVVHNLDGDAVKRLLNVTHQVVATPCDVLQLREAIDRAWPARQEALHPQRATFMAHLPPLPGVPPVYLDLVQALQEENVTDETLGALIERDPKVVEAMMPLVRSAAISHSPHAVNTPADAISCLGIGSVKNIVLAVEAFAGLNEAHGLPQPLEALWQHSWQTALLARRIVLAENRSHLAEDAFLAGFLHDLGKLVLASSCSDAYRGVIEEWHNHLRPLWEIEHQRLGVSHAAVGAYLLGLWGLPAAVVAGVEFHHQPRESGKRDFNLPMAVHVADILEHEMAGTTPLARLAQLDAAYVAELGYQDRLAVWRQDLRTAQAA